jgi:hypothetical protein
LAFGLSTTKETRSGRREQAEKEGKKERRGKQIKEKKGRRKIVPLPPQLLGERSRHGRGLPDARRAGQ